MPLRTVYNQWTQFTVLPRFMKGLKEVQQVNDKRLSWKGEVGLKSMEGEVEIYDQVPDSRIAWRSVTGTKTEGVLFFESVPDEGTKVTLRISYEPTGLIEKTVDALGLVEERITADLQCFKEKLEDIKHETGEWRGEIHDGVVTR